MTKGLQWATGALGLLPIGLAVFSVPVFAQIVPDNTLGSESSQVTPNVNIRGLPGERIDGGAVRGSALFHSFSEFNVNNGQRVYFSNPAGIADIFSRVTGSNVSNILGKLGVDGGANLFLLNPNGILFGPNAQLDIQGSFLATTGSSFKFSDGSEFSATNPQAAPLLSINVTPGVQWGANQPGATITNRGNLSAGQDLTLAAGNLDLQGQLQAGRDLTLQSQDTLTVRDTVSSPFVATSGRNLAMQGNQNIDIFALNHPQSQLQSGGNFSLISDGNISGDAHFSSGGNLSMLTLAGTPGNFVSWFDPIIRANGDVQFGDYTGVALKVEATGSIQGGNIRITGPDSTTPVDDPDYATLTGSPSVILRAGLDSVSTPNLPQNGLGNLPTDFTSGTNALGQPPGSITVASIDTSSHTGGDGGSIILSATGDITTTGSFPDPRGTYYSPIALGSLSYSSSGDSRNGGAITLTAGGDITTGNLASSSSSGNGGAIALTAQNNIQTGSLVAYTGSGSGGNITITSRNGEIKTNDSVGTATGFDAYNGGDITFKAKGNITIDGFTRSDGGDKGESGAINITSETGNVIVNETIYSKNFGLKGGDINITALAGSIFLTDEAGLISGNTSFATGKGGDINITTGSLSVTNGAQLNASTQGSGVGGNLTITARNSVTLSGGGQLLAETSGTGRAGNVLITAEGQVALTGGQISTNLQAGANVPSGQRSNITIKTGNLSVTEGGKISASVNAADSTENLPAGQGDAGNINIDVAETTLLSGENSRIRNVIEAGAIGQGGTITLNTGSLTVDNDAAISASTSGRGNAGQVTVTAKNDVSLQQRGRISSAVRAGAVGNGGVINLESGSLTLSDGGKIDTLSEKGSGTAGDVNITASTVTLNQDGKITAETDAGGSANPANITLRNVNTLNLSNNSSISASTQTGQAGSINLNQGQNQNPAALVTLNNSRISAHADGEGGNAGGITLNTSQLNLENNAKILASNISGTSQDITLQGLNTLQLSNNSEISASTGSGQGGSVSVNAQGGNVALTGDSHIKAEANGGQAGNLDITANQLRLRDRSSATVSSTGRGTAGKLAVSAPEVILENSAKLAATTQAGSGGDIQLQNLSSLQLSNGSEISASTQSGTGGNVSVNAPGGTITLSDNSSLKAEATQGGQAGNLQITANKVTLREGSQATVSSPQGQAGNLSITANNLLLDEGRITAETGKRSDQGGANIKLQVTDLLLLRHNSLISANATGDANGGNITIKAPFVVAVPYENSDIIANAFSGDGGQINIIGNYWLFGLKPQSRQSFDSLRQNRTSDISASSQSGNQGNINIQSLSVDPSQGLTALPVDIVDPSRQIVNRCGAGNSKSANAQGEFVVTGRGGLPPSPDDMQRSGAITPGWVTRDGGKSSSSSAPVEPPATPATPPLVEAQGMFINANGEVVLTAQTPTTTPHQPGIAEPLCSPGTNGNE